MKRILNLNDFGLLALRLIGLFLIVIPLVAYALDRVLFLLQISLPVLLKIAWGSLALGGLLVILFFLLIVLEQFQDHFLDQAYRRSRHTKVRLSERYFECQYCGYQKVESFQKICPVCGRDLN